ncbi:MAG: hypothetical protein HYV32_00305 [Candidatus Kerfeldbacteria bacterium]|nr:hypothetical protein [Candidatus Kerfeldbacteria bacterium]
MELFKRQKRVESIPPREYEGHYEVLKNGESRRVFQNVVEHSNAADIPREKRESHVRTPHIYLDARSDYGGPGSNDGENQDSMFVGVSENGTRSYFGVVYAAGAIEKFPDKVLPAGLSANYTLNEALKNGKSLDEAIQETATDLKQFDADAFGVIATIDDRLHVGVISFGYSQCLTFRKQPVQSEESFSLMYQIPDKYALFPKGTTGGHNLPGKSFEFEAQEGDIMVFVSDGVNDLVTQYEIQQIVAAGNGDTKKIQEDLFQLAYNRNNSSGPIDAKYGENDPLTIDHAQGQGDNITVQVVRVSRPTQKPEPQQQKTKPEVESEPAAPETTKQQQEVTPPAEEKKLKRRLRLLPSVDSEAPVKNDSRITGWKNKLHELRKKARSAQATQDTRDMQQATLRAEIAELETAYTTELSARGKQVRELLQMRIDSLNKQIQLRRESSGAWTEWRVWIDTQWQALGEINLANVIQLKKYASEDNAHWFRKFWNPANSETVNFALRNMSCRTGIALSLGVGASALSSATLLGTALLVTQKVLSHIASYGAVDALSTGWRFTRAEKDVTKALRQREHVQKPVSMAEVKRLGVTIATFEQFCLLVGRNPMESSAYQKAIKQLATDIETRTKADSGAGTLDVLQAQQARLVVQQMCYLQEQSVKASKKLGTYDALWIFGKNLTAAAVGSGYLANEVVPYLRELFGLSEDSAVKFTEGIARFVHGGAGESIQHGIEALRQYIGDGEPTPTPASSVHPAVADSHTTTKLSSESTGSASAPVVPKDTPPAPSPAPSPVPESTAPESSPAPSVAHDSSTPQPVAPEPATPAAEPVPAPAVPPETPPATAFGLHEGKWHTPIGDFTPLQWENMTVGNEEGISTVLDDPKSATVRELMMHKQMTINGQTHAVWEGRGSGKMQVWVIKADTVVATEHNGKLEFLNAKNGHIIPPEEYGKYFEFKPTALNLPSTVADATPAAAQNPIEPTSAVTSSPTGTVASVETAPAIIEPHVGSVVEPAIVVQESGSTTEVFTPAEPVYVVYDNAISPVLPQVKGLSTEMYVSDSHGDPHSIQQVTVDGKQTYFYEASGKRVEVSTEQVQRLQTEYQELKRFKQYELSPTALAAYDPLERPAVIRHMWLLDEQVQAAEDYYRSMRGITTEQQTLIERYIRALREQNTTMILDYVSGTADISQQPEGSIALNNYPDTLFRKETTGLFVRSEMADVTPLTVANDINASAARERLQIGAHNAFAFLLDPGNKRFIKNT